MYPAVQAWHDCVVQARKWNSETVKGEMLYGRRTYSSEEDEFDGLRHDIMVATNDCYRSCPDERAKLQEQASKYLQEPRLSEFLTWVDPRVWSQSYTHMTYIYSTVAARSRREIKVTTFRPRVARKSG